LLTTRITGSLPARKVSIRLPCLGSPKRPADVRMLTTSCWHLPHGAAADACGGGGDASVPAVVFGGGGGGCCGAAGAAAGAADALNDPGARCKRRRAAWPVFILTLATSCWKSSSGISWRAFISSQPSLSKAAEYSARLMDARNSATVDAMSGLCVAGADELYEMLYRSALYPLYRRAAAGDTADTHRPAASVP